MLTHAENATPATPRSAPSGLRRLAGISASLVGTQALTSVLGLAFWTLAARSFSPTDVGVAGAAVSMMMLLSAVGSLGLGTLLIARLPLTPQGERRLLVRTSLLLSGGTGALLGLAIPPIAVHLFGATNLTPLTASPLTLLSFAVGTGVMGIVLVLDQAVLTLGVGVLQFERNVLASVVKIAALAAFGAAGLTGGMLIFLAWTVGTVVSLPLISWRTRGGRSLQTSSRIADPRVLKGLGRMAASHHALNITLQAALQILPILVTVMLSAQENAYFNTAVMVSGFVFALPYAIAISLFASADGSERDLVQRIRLTIPFSLGVSVLANVVMFPLAGIILGIFGGSYATEGVDILRALTLAGIPFVVKDHFIALRRVQGRTTEAVRLLAVFLVVELAAAAVGASVGGTIGLCLAWVGVLFVEAIILSVPLYRSWRQYRRDEVAASGVTAAVPAATAGDRTRPSAPATPATPVTEAPGPDPDATTDTGRHRRVPADLTTDLPPTPATGVRRRLTGSSNLAGPAVLLMALGVFVMALAANAGRAGSTSGWAQFGWVAGLVLVFLPAAVRVVLPRTPHVERMVLAVALPMFLQFSRLVLNPTRYAFHDELIHANTLRQIDVSSHLFSFNPLLPVSGYYPGLEIVTDAVHSMTGLSMFAAGVVTMMLAKAVISLAVIAVVSLLTGSRRAGAIGAVVYVVNPQQLFFNSQYSYQTLALPLAVLAVYLFAVRRRGSRFALSLPLLTLAMVTLTHHLTAMLLVVAFAVWYVIALVVDRRSARTDDDRTDPGGISSADRRRDRRGLLWMVGAGGALSLIAAVNPGSPVGAYLGAIVTSSTQDVTSLTEGQQTKALFADTAGTGPAWWEQILLLGAVGITMLSMFVVLRYLKVGWRGGRTFALVLGLLALVYPVIPAGHLTRATAEVGDRASGFVFVGLAVVIGWWLCRSTWRLRSSLLFAGAATIVFLGNIVLGSGPTSGQLPGPYEISADARSIDADNVAAAEWLATGVPADSVVYGDRTSGLLAAADGGQFTVRHVSTNIDASRLLLDPEYTDKDVALIRQAGIDYLVVDTRLSDGLPHQQVYIENGEFGMNDRTGPVPAAALTKFASVPGVQRVYDNGSLVIYDVRGLQQ